MSQETEKSNDLSRLREGYQPDPDRFEKGYQPTNQVNLNNLVPPNIGPADIKPQQSVNTTTGKKE